MRITEGQLRRIIRQEVRSLRENRLAALGIPGLTSYEDLVRMVGEREAENAAMQLSAGAIPVSLQKLMGTKGGKKRARRAAAPRVTGGRPKVRAAAQMALDMYYSVDDPSDIVWQIVEKMVEMTAKYEPGYEPEYPDAPSETDRLQIIGDQASAAVALIRKVDPDAARVLETALGEFEGF
jgi:hypothetical protein